MMLISDNYRGNQSHGFLDFCTDLVRETILILALLLLLILKVNMKQATLIMALFAKFIHREIRALASEPGPNANAQGVC